MTKLEKISVFISLGVILFLIFLIAFSEHGFFDYKRFKAKEAFIVEQTRKLQEQNREIEKQIQSLKTDIEYIKHIAKHEHDMAEEDELIFKDQTIKRKTP